MSAHGSKQQQGGGRGEANYFQVGLQGRKTGVVLEDFINQDEDGFDDMDKVFETARPITPPPPTKQLTKPKLNSPELTPRQGSPMHLVSPGSSISLTDVYKSRELDSPQRKQLATERNNTKLVAKALLRQREESYTTLSLTDQTHNPPPSPSPPRGYSPDPQWSQVPSPPPTTIKKRKAIPLKTHPTKGQNNPQSTFTLPDNGRHHHQDTTKDHSSLPSNPTSPQPKPNLPMAKRTGPPPKKPHLARRTGERAIPRVPSPDPTTTKDDNLPLPLYDIHDLMASASVLDPHPASKEPSLESSSSTQSSPPPPVTSRAKKKKITRTKLSNPPKKLTQKTNKSVPKPTTKKNSNRISDKQLTPSIEEEEESTSTSQKADPIQSDVPPSRNSTKKTKGRKGTSQRKPEKGEMIVDTYIVAAQEDPTNNVEEKEGEETGLRRSKRARYGRLKFWKNEKVDYEWVDTPQGPVQQLKVKRLPDASPARSKRVTSTTATKRSSSSSTRDHAARYHTAVARSTAPATPTLTDSISVYPDPGSDLLHPTWGTPSSGPGYELVTLPSPTVAYLDLHPHATYLPPTSLSFTTFVLLYGTVRATLPTQTDPHLLSPGTTLLLDTSSDSSPSLTLYNPSTSSTARLLLLSPHH